MVSWDMCGCWVESSAPDATAVVAGWIVNSCGCTLWAAPAVTAGCGAVVWDCQPGVAVTAGCGAVVWDCQPGVAVTAGCGAVVWDCQPGVAEAAGCGAVVWDCQLGVAVTSPT